MDTDVRGVIQYGEMCIKYAMQRRKERKNEGAHWEDGCAAGKTLLVPLERSGRVASLEVRATSSRQRRPCLIDSSSHPWCIGMHPQPVDCRDPHQKMCVHH
jgi:hypothetical protein